MIEKADLVLLVLDKSLPYPSIVDSEVEKIIKNKKSILVLNKSDLKSKIKISVHYLDDVPKTEISATNKESIQNLTDQISNCLLEDSLVENEFNMSVNLRQSNALKSHWSVSKNSIENIKSEENLEFAIPDLKESILHLGEIVGYKDNEAMLDLLFSNFCIGK